MDYKIPRVNVKIEQGNSMSPRSLSVEGFPFNFVVFNESHAVFTLNFVRDFLLHKIRGDSI